MQHAHRQQTAYCTASWRQPDRHPRAIACRETDRAASLVSPLQQGAITAGRRVARRPCIRSDISSKAPRSRDSSSDHARPQATTTSRCLVRIAILRGSSLPARPAASIGEQVVILMLPATRPPRAVASGAPARRWAHAHCRGPAGGAHLTNPIAVAGPGAGPTRGAPARLTRLPTNRRPVVLSATSAVDSARRSARRRGAALPVLVGLGLLGSRHRLR